MGQPASLISSSRFTPLATIVEDRHDTQPVPSREKSTPNVDRKKKAPTRKVNRLSADSRKFFVKLTLKVLRQWHCLIQEAK